VERLGCCNKPLAFKPNPDALHGGIVAFGEDSPPAFFPMGKIPPPANLQPSYALEEQESCGSILGASVPPPLTPALRCHAWGCRAIACPGKGPMCDLGERKGLAGSSMALPRMEKSQGSALSPSRHLSWEVFFFPSSQHGHLEISYAGSRLQCFHNETTRLANP